MEKGPKQAERSGTVSAAAGLLAVCLLALVVLTGGSTPAVEAAAPAEVELVRGAAETPVNGGVGRKVIPVGRAVGIKLFSDGVLVVGLSPVETDGGTQCPGRDCGLKTGDVITHVNGEEVDTIEEIKEMVTRQGGEQLTIQAIRGQRQMQLTTVPVANTKGNYQLGVWLRDSMAGIGTVTFYDPGTGVFAALGHGINDVDTAMLMPLESGAIMEAAVSDVKKGVSGTPGELHGQFDLTRDLGTLYANTDRGIFGRMDQSPVVQGMQPVEVASKAQVQPGKALIRSNVRGDQIEEFDIEITKLFPESDGRRDMMVQVTDPRLLEATGGIVQGMSGSPIIQNGRLVGAVTHVLVDDPTRGYGILIENMLEAAE